MFKLFLASSYQKLIFISNRTRVEGIQKPGYNCSVSIYFKIFISFIFQLSQKRETPGIGFYSFLPQLASESSCQNLTRSDHSQKCKVRLDSFFLDAGFTSEKKMLSAVFCVTSESQQTIFLALEKLPKSKLLLMDHLTRGLDQLKPIFVYSIY